MRKVTNPKKAWASPKLFAFGDVGKLTLCFIRKRRGTADCWGQPCLNS
jgi:hypothetical protein